MDTTLRLDEMRGRFIEMKQDLTASMKLCRRQFDISNRLMFTITELLYNAIENVQYRKPFKPSSLLFASFDVIGKCEKEKTTNAQEIVMLKFARSFTLFMDSLSGYCMIDHRRREAAPQSTASARKPDTLLTSAQKRPRSSAPHADNNPQPITRCPRPSPIKEEFTDPPLPPADEVAECDRDIKLEEPDYKADASQSVSTSAQEHSVIEKSEIKEEGDLIKEEPLEEPVRDTVSFNAPSTSRDPTAYREVAYKWRTARPPPPYVQAPVIRTVACPFCNVAMQSANLDHHIRLYHKGRWLEYVSKCPEVECDYRSHSATDIRMHKQATHNGIYENWKTTARFALPPDTKCPYCKVILKSLSQFINHMDAYHSRLTTYEVPILKCASCRFVASRCYQMFEHWRERTPNCCKGLRFVYSTAERVLKADHDHCAKEAINDMQNT